MFNKFHKDIITHGRLKTSTTMKTKWVDEAVNKLIFISGHDILHTQKKKQETDV